MTFTREKKRTLILVIVCGLMVLASSYYFGFRWINEARGESEKREVTLAENIEKMNKTIDDGAAAEKKIQMIGAKLKPVREQMPPEQAETWIARAIDTVATRHKLKLKGSRLVDPDPFAIDEVKVFQHFGLVGYAFSIQGTYFQLGEFLADLEGTLSLMVVEHISINAGAGGAPNIHEMSVKVDMVTQKD